MYYCFVIVKERVYNISKAQNRSSTYIKSSSRCRCNYKNDSVTKQNQNLTVCLQEQKLQVVVGRQ